VAVTTRRRLGGTALVWVIGFGALRVTLLAPEVCPTVPPDRLVDAAAAAGSWLAKGQDSSGRYLYEYDREAGAAMPGYNVVRHAGVTMSLYQLVAAGRHELLEPADRGLRYMLRSLEAAGDGAALGEPGVRIARLGGTALLAAALAARRDATGDDRYDDELRALGRFMAGQVGPNGRTLVGFDLDAQRPVPGETSRYATGEAGWALARLDTVLPGEGWDEPARRVADYLATERDEAEGLDYAPWPDQWAAYLLGELAPSGLGGHHVAYARALAARFAMLVRFESQKHAWPVAFVDPRARGGGVGVWVEGLGALARAAATDERLADLRPALATRLQCGAGVLVDRQAADGAWFRDDVTRMDDQQHALSGLLAAAGRLGEQP
jgi:hypothetical protein